MTQAREMKALPGIFAEALRKVGPFLFLMDLLCQWYVSLELLGAPQTESLTDSEANIGKP